MDAFEDLVASLLRADGYWVHQGYKIELSREEKRDLGNPSMPRPEIDIVACKPGTAELLAIECKSYFDSGGVKAGDLLPGGRNPQRYKMFVNTALREKILERLAEQLSSQGSLSGAPTPRLGLVYGHASSRNSEELTRHFNDNDWLLLGPEWLRGRLQKLALQSWDNQIASVVAKLLLPRTLSSQLETHT